jgi:heme-degrading monooxygenase HmoA
MIARIWHGIAKTADSDEYLEYLNKTGIQDYRNTEGNIGALILRRAENEITHFQTISFWDSIESIKEFAGDDYEKARYYPQDELFLLEFEENVFHFDVPEIPEFLVKK